MEVASMILQENVSLDLERKLKESSEKCELTQKGLNEKTNEFQQLDRKFQQQVIKINHFPRL